MAETTGATLTWQGDLRFLARSGSGFEVLLDSPSRPAIEGPSPMELFVESIAGCMAMDVVSILLKMKQQLTGATFEIVAQRAPTHPKVVTHIDITCRLVGRGLEREKAERAAELSRTTYCSAINSLRADCTINLVIELQEA